MSNICKIINRGIVTVLNNDRVNFLQGLVSNDVRKLSSNNPIYACLLTSQGKFLHDFIMTTDNNVIFLECEYNRADELVKTLKIYAMRADVKIDNLSNDYNIYASWGANKIDKYYQDPRHNNLGFRIITQKNIATTTSFDDYDRHRILLKTPDGSRDMKPKFSTLLESNIDELQGISWDKGCYMGQELTARMHYRGLLKKRLIMVQGEKLPEFGADIKDIDGHVIGEMRSSCGDVGLALLKISSIKNNVKFKTENGLINYINKVI